MDNFFSIKQVKVLDPNVFKKGFFISLCYMNYDRVDGYTVNPHAINGIINSVGDDYFTYIDVEGSKNKVDTESFYREGVTLYPYVPVKILGIKSTVAEGRE